jgi:hypothetical protein
VPLAQLRSLASLDILECTGFTPTSFESFLTASVQGCALKLFIISSKGEEEVHTQLRASYNKVRHSLGACAIPYWPG